MPLPGNTSDVATFVRFADQILEFGPQSLYEPTDLGQVQGHFTYPPLFPMILAGSVWVERAILRLLWQPNESAFGAHSSQLDGLVVKAWAVAGDALLAWFAWREVRQSRGRRSANVVVAATLWSPAVAYAGAYWGQIDSMLAAVVVAAVSSMLNRRWWLVGIWVSFGMLLKPQMVVAVPIVALGTVILGRLGGVVRAACASLGVGAILTVPFWATGRLGLLASAYLHATGAYPTVTVNAYNIWMALCAMPLGLTCGSDVELLVWGLTYRQVGLLCLGACVASVLALLVRPFMILSEIGTEIPHRIRVENRARGAIFLGMSLVFLAFFMLPTQVHERYLLPAIVILTTLITLNTEYKLLYLILSITFVVNLMSVISISSDIFENIVLLGFSPLHISWINLSILIIMICCIVEEVWANAFEKKAQICTNYNNRWWISVTMCVGVISIMNQAALSLMMYLPESISIWIIIICSGSVLARLSSWLIMLLDSIRLVSTGVGPSLSTEE